MESTFTLLRVRGIPIGINWSWLFVFAIVVWSLSTALFPATYPGLDGTAYLAMAVVAAVLFFGSVLLHELGHALRAVREGMPIDGITLWLLGGVAKLRGTPPSPGAEFRVAIWGPAITVALAAAFGLAALLGDRLGAPGPVQGVVDYLARINALVLAFNLVPALPLDGGRVLRAWLWRRQRSFSAATRSAARAGQAFGFMLVAVGLLELFAGGGLGGIWFAFLGWFLIQASQGEATMAAVRQALGGAKVRDLMTSDLVTVRPDLPVAELVDRAFAGRRFSTYPVTENGTLVGMVSLKMAAEVPPSDRSSRRVRDVMVPATDLTTLSPDDDVLASLRALESRRRSMVVEDGRLVGVLSGSDVARAVEVNLAGPPPAPPRRSGVVVWVVVALAILLAGAALYHPPYVVIAPGPTADVSDGITIGGVPVTEINGEYLLTSVTLQQPSALRTLVALLRPDRDVLSFSSVIPRDVRPDDYYRAQRSIFRESRMLAAAAAARSVGLPVSVEGTGVRIVDLLPGTSVADSLRRGDVVVAVDGEPVTHARDLGPIIRSRPAGTRFSLTVERDGQRTDVEVKSQALPRLAGGVGLGVAVETEGLRVDLPFDIRFADSEDVGGPSAGLAYALAIADALSQADYANGRTVAATGSIDVDGDVGPVGGVGQKAIAAEESQADLFLVPASEVEEARQAGVRVNGVETLDRALALLEAS